MQLNSKSAESSPGLGYKNDTQIYNVRAGQCCSNSDLLNCENLQWSVDINSGGPNEICYSGRKNDMTLTKILPG